MGRKIMIERLYRTFFDYGVKVVPERAMISLEALPQLLENHTYVGVTINYPHRHIALQLSETQKNILEEHLEDFQKMFKTQTKWPLNFVETHLEQCKDSTFHIHACLEFKGLFSDACIASLITDIARIIYKSRNKWLGKNCNFDSSKYFDKYLRYRAPFACVQFYKTEKEVHDWIEYIRKCV